MPLPTEAARHQAKADYDAAFRACLDSVAIPCDNWKILARFYGVLHWVKTYLGAAYPNLGSRINHVERNDDVRTFMRPVYPSYKALYDVSRKCRYDADYYASFDDAIASDEDAAEIREFVLERL